MTRRTIPCPRCGENIDPQTWYCPFCGVSLALAALLAEQDLTGVVRKSDLPISPEILVPRLGECLKQKGILNADDLNKALSYQAEQLKLGRQILVGQSLLELGLVQKEPLDQVITEQILELQSALQNANTELGNRYYERTAELENALNRLSELNQLKSNFIANISHELRTPLTHIRGYIDLLVRQELGPLTLDQRDALDVLNRSEERLEQLIENLIQYSLVARGDLDVKISKLPLEEILKDVLLIAQQKCIKKNLVLVNKIPNELPQVKADRQKITWVLTEFVENAIKFTAAGKSITLEVQLGRKRVILIVSDTGIGIHKDQIEEIFEPFHQLDGSSKRRFGGTGLGLAMAKHIIDAHGSKINLRSELGKGTSFWFSLPKAD